METCRKYREALTLMACRALGGNEEASLLRHIETCSACRRYYAVMQHLSESLEALDDETQGIEAPASLHARVESAVIAGARVVAPSAGLHIHAWKWTAAAACLLALAAALFYAGHRTDEYRRREEVVMPPTQLDRDLPYLSVYRQALSAPEAVLDDLLEAHSKYRPRDYGDPLAEPPGKNERENLILKKERHNEKLDIASGACGDPLRRRGGTDC